MMDKTDWGATGFIIGVLVTVFLWLAFAEIVERAKVNAGYLTFKNKTYTVKLYDTLDIPEPKTD